MAHPQTNFSSNFQGSDGNDSALDITVNGETTEYRPSGGDQSIELTEPVIFEMNENPTYAEINPVIGLHVPVYLHVSGAGIDYMVPYVGQESGGEGLRFAIPDSQNKCIKYWICRNGASWVSGENPLDNIGWTRGVGSPAVYNLRWFKICEAPAPAADGGLASTTFQITCATDNSGKALDSGTFEVSVYKDRVQGRWLTYTSPGIDKYHINRVSVTVNTKLEVFVEMRDFADLTFMAVALTNTGLTPAQSPFVYENGTVEETTAPYGATAHFLTAPSLPATVMDADEIVLSRWYAYDAIQNSMDENKPVVVRVASKDKSYLITGRDLSGAIKYFYGIAFDNANTDFEVLRLEYDTDTWTYSFIGKVCENKVKGQLFIFDVSELTGSEDNRRTLFANIASAVKNKGTVIMQEYGDYLDPDIGQYDEWAEWHLVSYRELQSGSNVLEFDKGFTYIAGGKVQFTRKTVTYVRSSALVSEQDVDYPVDVSY